MQEKTLKTSTRWAYAISNNGFFISMTLFTIYPMVFMTACLHLPLAQAGLILTLTKLSDLVLGFFSGAIIEKVKLPWGKYRSWFLVGPILAGIGCCLFFSPLLMHVPQGAVVPLGVFLMVLWNVSSNIVMTCHSSLNNLLVQDPMERVSIFKLSNQLQAITGFIAGFFMMKIVFAVGGEMSINLPGMQVIGILYSLIYFGLYFVFFMAIRDFKDSPSHFGRRVSVITTIKLLFTNRKCAVVTLSGIFGWSAETFYKALVSYLFLYVLLAPKVFDAYNWSIAIAAFIGASLAQSLTKVTSKKNTFVLGFFLMAIGLGGAYFASATPILTLLLICFATVGANFARTTCVPIYSDIADYVEFDTGEKIISYVMTLYNVIFKIAGLVAAQAATALAAVGFVSGEEITAEVATGVKGIALLLPAGFALVAAIIMFVFYNLDEKKMPEVQAGLQARLAELKKS